MSEQISTKDKKRAPKLITAIAATALTIKALTGVGVAEAEPKKNSNPVEQIANKAIKGSNMEVKIDQSDNSQAVRLMETELHQVAQTWLDDSKISKELKDNTGTGANGTQHVVLTKTNEDGTCTRISFNGYVFVGKDGTQDFDSSNVEDFRVLQYELGGQPTSDDPEGKKNITELTFFEYSHELENGTLERSFHVNGVDTKGAFSTQDMHDPDTATPLSQAGLQRASQVLAALQLNQ